MGLWHYLKLWNLKKRNHFYAKLLKSKNLKHQYLWLGFTRQPTMAKNPDYVGRPAKASFDEKLKKKLSSMSSSKRWGLQAAFLKPALWQLLILDGTSSGACCRGSIFHLDDAADKKPHDGSTSDTCCFASNGLLIWTQSLIIGTMHENGSKFDLIILFLKSLTLIENIFSALM